MFSSFFLFFKKHRIILLFLFVFIVAFVPRLITFFGSQDFFEIDPSYDFVAAKKIVIDHKIALTGGEVGGIGGFHKGPLWHYLLAIPFIITNGDPYGGKVFMFVVSNLTVMLAFFLTRKMFNLKTAVFISIFLAISPYLIVQAGLIWNPFIIPIIIVIFQFSLYKVFKKNYKYMFIIGFLFGVMTSFEIAVAGTLLVQLIVIAVYFLIKKVIPIKYFILSLFVFLITLSPYLIYDLNNNFYNTKGILKMLDVAKNHTQNISTVNKNKILENRIETFRWNFFSTFTPHRIVGPILFFLIYLGVYFFVKNKKNSSHNRLYVLYLASSPFLIFIIFLFYPGNIFAWWLLELTVYYCFLVGILIGYFYKNLFFKITIIIIIAAFLKAAVNREYLEFKSSFTYPPKKYTIKLSEPIDYIFQNSNKKKFGIQVIGLKPSDRIYEYEYMIWWMGHVRYNFLPTFDYIRFSEDNVNNFNSVRFSSNKLYYILLEYNPASKSKMEDWIKNYKSDVILETKYFQNRYIVQKRIIQ